MLDDANDNSIWFLNFGIGNNLGVNLQIIKQPADALFEYLPAVSVLIILPVGFLFYFHTVLYASTSLVRFPLFFQFVNPAKKLPFTVGKCIMISGKSGRIFSLEVFAGCSGRNC